MPTKKTTESAEVKKPAVKKAAGATATKGKKAVAGKEPAAEKVMAAEAIMPTMSGGPLPVADEIRVATAAKSEISATDLASFSEAIALADGKYVYARGRRKTATATIKLWMGGKGEITANGKPLDQHFKLSTLRDAVMAPLKAAGLDKSVKIDMIVSGGGMTGQADAGRHGIARAIVSLNEAYRVPLKRMGFLTRDSRAKERKKFGLKSARRAPQWAKR